MTEKKLKCPCGRKGRLIIACKICCPSDCFPDYKEKKGQGEQKR